MDDKKAGSQRGGINISGNSHISVGGDMVSGDKIVHGNEYHAGGDINKVDIGAGAQVGQIAVGKNITQTNIVGADEKKELADKLEQVNRQLQALAAKMDEEKQELAQFQLEKLTHELTKTDGAPNAEQIQRTTTKLLKNVPALGGPLGVVFQTAAAQKILAQTGMTQWAQEQFS